MGSSRWQPNRRLRARREARGWSRARLADQVNAAMAADGLAGTCTGGYVEKWETGQARPGELFRGYLARALGCTLDALGLEPGHNADLARLATSSQPVVLLQVPEPLAGLFGLMLTAFESGTLGGQPLVGPGGSSLERRAFNRYAASLVAALMAGRTLDPGQVGALTSAVEYRRIGMSGVGNLRQVVEGYRRLDDEIGSASLRPLVDVQLGMVAGLRAAGQREQVAAELDRVNAELHQLAGWLAFDAGDHQTARAHFNEGLRAAQHAGDDALAGYITAYLAIVAIYEGRPAEGLALVEAAHRRARQATARVGSWLATVEAEAHANLGDAAATERALGRAEDALARSRLGDDPPWIYHHDRSGITSAAGTCYLALRWPERARPAMRETIELSSPSVVREEAVYLTRLGATYVPEGEIAEACRLGLDALAIARNTESHRGEQRVRELRRQLDPWAAEPAVRELDEQLLAL